MKDKYRNIYDDIEDLKEKFPLNQYTLDYFKSLDIYDSLHIEGNTLSREAITVFLEEGITVHGKPFKEFLEVHNYNKALNMLKINIKDQKFELTPMFIRQLHKTVSSEILEEKYCGNYRDDFVFLRGSTYVPPHYEDVPKLVEELCENYNKWNSFSDETRFENIISTFRKLESIHPFVDGNGRTGRLMMNYLLLNNGYPFLWIDSEHRVEYLQSFETREACKKFHAERMIEMYNFLEKHNPKYSILSSVEEKKKEIEEKKLNKRVSSNRTMKDDAYEK